MMRTFWRAYYKIKLGADYKNTIYNAKAMKAYVKISGSGRVANFYNVNGEQIRGWYKAPFKVNPRHPLENYYNNK